MLFLTTNNREMGGLTPLFKDRLPLIIRGGMDLLTNPPATTFWLFGIVVLQVAARKLKHPSTPLMFRTIVV